MNKRIVSFICMAWLVVGGMATGPVHATVEGGAAVSGGAPHVHGDSGHGGAHGTPMPALASPAAALSGGAGQKADAPVTAGASQTLAPAAAGASQAAAPATGASQIDAPAVAGASQASAPAVAGATQTAAPAAGASQAAAPAAAGAMPGETHGDHGATTAPGKDLLAPADASHTHPVASAASPAGVDEKLGAVIPQGITFRDEAGNAVDVRSLMDVPTLIAPVYFSCPTVCNMLQSSIARVLPGVSLVPGKDYRVLSVSFDDLDTPALAASKKRNYLAAVGNDFPQDGWRFLTADIKELNRLMDAIGFRFTRQGRDFIHPVVLVAVAPGGKVVRYLYGNSFMPFDVTMALSEAAEGKVGLSVKRVLSYCFTYDPQGRKYVFDFVRIAGAVILFGAGVLFFVLIRGGRKQKANPDSPQEKQQ